MPFGNMEAIVSLSLTLVFDHRGNSFILGYNRLKYETGDMHALADILRPMAAPLSGGIEWYDDEGLEHIDTDSYGDRLTYLSAAQLARVLAGEQWVDPWGRAVASFVQNLPSDMMVILHWG